MIFGPLLDLRASMGPPHDGGGERLRLMGIILSMSLQWGRLTMEAERVRGAARRTLCAPLQWGRLTMEAESRSRSASAASSGALQWGRLTMEAERWRLASRRLS